jgi:hypothetical protein
MMATVTDGPTSVHAALTDTNNIEDALRDAVLVHNATPNATTGESPFCVVFGVELVFPGDAPWVSPTQLNHHHRSREQV